MIELILILAVVGFFVYAVTTWMPMPAPFKTGIYVLVAICLIYFLMQVFNVRDLPLPGRR